MLILADYGEDRLVAALLARLPTSVLTGENLLAGAGDDCAVVRDPAIASRFQLLKTDCVIEGVHYLPDAPPEKVGWKAMCRPLSDIAAMGGRPLYALVTLALPGSATLEYAQSIYAGLGRASERYGILVVGGETARSPTVGFVSVVLTGEVDPAQLVRRTGGQPGHLIYVTGRLGGSFRSGKHLDFDPRLDEAQWLTRSFPVSAMMDLSDGLNRDLGRLATASGTGYAVASGMVPCSVGCNVAQALSDGEDYELLFTLEPSARDRLETAWRGAWPTLKLTCIGSLCEDGERSGLNETTGFDHFKQSV